MPGSSYHGCPRMSTDFSSSLPGRSVTRRAVNQSTSYMRDPTIHEPPDLVLVARAQAGELEAFEALAHRYERRVYALALRMLRHQQDAEDVTQQTFLSALENLAQFRGDASFSTWLLRIA